MLESKESYFQLKENKNLLRLFYFLLGAVFIALVFIYRFYFWPFLFALLIYIAVRPLQEFFLRRIRSRLLTSVLMIFLLFMMVLTPAFLLLLFLAEQAFDFYSYARNLLSRPDVAAWITGNDFAQWIYQQLHLNKGEIITKVLSVIEQVSMAVFTNVSVVLTFSINFALNFIFMLLMLFFLFKDAYRLEDAFYRILPFPDDIERDVVDRLKEVVKMLLAGNLFIMALQGIMTGLGLYIGGLKGGLLWGSIAAVFSLIPVIGTTLIWLPASMVLVLMGNYFSAAFVAVWCLGWYLGLENFLKPALFGKKLNFHPLIFFFLLLGSIKAFGLAGVIVGPVLLTLFFSLWEIYKLLSGYDADRLGQTPESGKGPV